MTPPKRDCLFFVADAAMAAVVDGFLARGHLDQRIGRREFDFDFELDMLVGSRLGGYTDGGIYKHCHRLLQENGYMETHEHLIVMLDQQFGGDRPAAEVREETLGRLQANGWSEDRADVIVIDPRVGGVDLAGQSARGRRGRVHGRIVARRLAERGSVAGRA